MRETDGKLLGVYSFGDVFWGGSRDVCVLVNVVMLDVIEIVCDGVDFEVYVMVWVNVMIFCSSDEALKRMAFELSVK